MSSVGIVIAHDDARIAEQIAEELEAAPDLFVAAAAVASAQPGHVVVAGGDALASLRSLDAPVIALASSEDAIASARAALAAGATDLILWPAEAARLPGAIRRAAGARATVAARGTVIAVAGARGGLGVTTLCAGLAASMHAVVLDLDAGAGQRAFAPGSPRRAAGDLVEPSPEEIDGALLAHPGDARCLHATPGDERPPRAVHALLRPLRALARVVVVDTGRCLSPGARAAFTTADARVLLVGNDVASVRAAAESALDAILVVRRARRGGIALRDLRAALDDRPLAAVIPTDASLARAVDLGTLPSRSHRAMRAIAALSRALEPTR